MHAWGHDADRESVDRRRGEHLPRAPAFYGPVFDASVKSSSPLKSRATTKFHLFRKRRYVLGPAFFGTPAGAAAEARVGENHLRHNSILHRSCRFLAFRVTCGLSGRGQCGWGNPHGGICNRRGADGVCPHGAGIKPGGGGEGGRAACVCSYRLRFVDGRGQRRDVAGVCKQSGDAQFKAGRL